MQWDGTSAAAPIVSGLVALVRSAYPNLDAAGVINRVIATANPNGHDVPSPIYGHGLIDAAAAVTAYVPPAAGPTPTALLKDWIHLHRRADVKPTPAPTPTAAAPVVPRADPDLPPENKASAWLPSRHTLTHVSIPLAVLLGFGILVTLFGTGATRQFRRMRRKS